MSLIYIDLNAALPFWYDAGQYRDRVRIYCDTDVGGKHTGRDMGRARKKRMEAGLTYLKMDLGIELHYDEPGTLTAPPQIHLCSMLFGSLFISNRALIIFAVP